MCINPENRQCLRCSDSTKATTDLKSFLLEEARNCLVLLDTGANEVVTPFVQSVWGRLSDAHHDQGGSVAKVNLSMAGDRKRPGYLTEWGEVMMNKGDTK